MATQLINGETVESTETAACHRCGIVLPVSDWPGNDPSNCTDVVCADAAGHLVCDDCAD